MRCRAADCPHPEFIGQESKPQGHMDVANVGPIHFACYWRILRDALGHALNRTGKGVT